MVAQTGAFEQLGFLEQSRRHHEVEGLQLCAAEIRWLQDDRVVRRTRHTAGIRINGDHQRQTICWHVCRNLPPTGKGPRAARVDVVEEFASSEVRQVGVPCQHFKEGSCGSISSRVFTTHRSMQDPAFTSSLWMPLTSRRWQRFCSASFSRCSRSAESIRPVCRWTRRAGALIVQQLSTRSCAPSSRRA